MLLATFLGAPVLTGGAKTACGPALARARTQRVLSHRAASAARVMMREGALPEWAETFSGSARSCA